MIPLSIPSIGGNEWMYVRECLDTGWVSSAGRYVDLFELKIAEYTGAKHAVACVNGTSALQVALRLAGVRPRDEVIVPTITFIAPVNAVRYNGAEPVFMDTDDYFNIDVEKTIDFIEKETGLSNDARPVTLNKKTGNTIRALVLVHMYGSACWLDELVPLCRERNIRIVEDAAESMGTRYTLGRFADRHTGTIGNLGCLSFNGNKIITTGGGGMVLTDDEELATKAKYLTTQAKDDPVHYIHNDIGYNFRLTNLQAALGVAQLEQLPKFLERKKKIHQCYTDAVEKIDGLHIMPTPEYADNNHWLNMLLIEPEVFGMHRESLMGYLQKNGIQSRPVWYPNHLQKMYRGCQTYRIDRAENIVNRTLCLPSSSDLRHNQVKDITNLLAR